MHISPMHQRLLAYAAVVFLAIALVGTSVVINRHYVTNQVNPLRDRITTIERIGPTSPSKPSNTPSSRVPAPKVGKTGKRGPRGVRGPAGKRGAIGHPGSRGLQGPQGPRGPQGAVGQHGSPGLPGRPGQNAVANTEQLVQTVLGRLPPPPPPPDTNAIVNRVVTLVCRRLPVPCH